MSVRLVLLGFLRERPLYGYEIKALIEERMADWTSIAFGSIYFALGKLSEEGFIEKVAEEQEGSRPSRSIYQITDAGREEFMRLLREVWSGYERQYFSLDIGLFFISALSKAERDQYLAVRVSDLETALEHISRHQDEEMQNEYIPPVANAIFEHTAAHLRAELEWTRSVQAKAAVGEYD